MLPFFINPTAFPNYLKWYNNTMLDISKITEYLYVGSKIGPEHLEELKLQKFNLIISMIGELEPAPVYMLPPFKTIWIRTFDTFLTPISLRELRRGIEASLPVIRENGKVLVFCFLGRRRSITMAAAILISMGYDSEEAVAMLMRARKVADPRRWYVRRRIRAFERYWRNQ